MSPELSLSFDWGRLDEGSPEERACFGTFAIVLGDISLSEGRDGFIARIRPGPLVSGYHLAEWFAWNWWRLTREPRRDAPSADWSFAHFMSTVGAGYLWPNVTIWSDRERTAVVAKPTHPQGFSAFRFTADRAVLLPTRAFECAIDAFMGRIRDKLRADGIADSNLDRIWSEVQAERADPVAAARRELEALLGCDPDGIEESRIERMIGEFDALGRDAVIELAAGGPPGQTPPTTGELAGWAKRLGSDTRSGDIASVTGLDLGPRATTPAWRQGNRAARALREQARLGQEPLSDARLAELCAVSPQVLEPTERAPLAFGLDDPSRRSGRIVLRSNFRTGRRFELARWLGDRIASAADEHLIPLTDARTYRQKVQRAFAAEFLCPFESLEAFLGGDYSCRRQEDAAQHFDVSERTVTTVLVNHGRLDRDVLDDEMDVSEVAA